MGVNLSAPPRPDPDAHFIVIHHATTVSYNLTGWLEKNKDPLNDTVVDILKNGSNSLIQHIFADHPGQRDFTFMTSAVGGRRGVPIKQTK